MEKAHSPVCPACGFRIFNRRYPKCERCGTALPETIAYSSEKREALQQKEREEDLARQARQLKAASIGANDFGFSADLGGGGGSCTSDGGSSCD